MARALTLSDGSDALSCADGSEQGGADYGDPSRSMPLEPSYVLGRTIRALQIEFPLEYNSHKAMLKREREGLCTVHDDLRAFKSFLLALPRHPGPGHTLDRTDNDDREYAKGKVQWRSFQEQANNRGTTIRMSYRGQLLTVTEVAKLTGQKPNTLRARRNRGWSDEEAVTGHRLRTGDTSDLEWAPGCLPKEWETAYRAWVRHERLGPDKDSASRRVFCEWIAGAQLRATRSELAKRFPAFYDPEHSDPGIDGVTSTGAEENGDVLPIELVEHPAHVAEQQIRAMLNECREAGALTVAEQILLRSLRKSLPSARAPEQAYAAMSQFQRHPIVRSGGLRAIYGPPVVPEGKQSAEDLANASRERMRRAVSRGLAYDDQRVSISRQPSAISPRTKDSL